MARLKIKDAPLLTTILGDEKIPTGGKGDFTLTPSMILSFVETRLPFATNAQLESVRQALDAKINTVKTELETSINLLDVRVTNNETSVLGVVQDLTLHKADKNNPHGVNKAQVGLSNVDNTSDANKPISTATRAALNQKANTQQLNDGLALKFDKQEAQDKIYKNGAALPYDSSITYNEGAVVVKDGELKQKFGLLWKPFNKDIKSSDVSTGISDLSNQGLFNKSTITTVSTVDDLQTLNATPGRTVYVKDLQRVYVYDTQWRVKAVNLSVLDFGAKTTGDATTSFELANSYAVANKVKIEIPENYSFQLDNSNINTANFYCGGSLIFKNHDRFMLSAYRKNTTNFNENTITLEDEFGAHSAGLTNSYTGFGGSCAMNGKEFIGLRSAVNHYYNATEPSSLVLYAIDRLNSKNAVTSQVLYTSELGSDVRDVNVSPLPDYGNRLLVKYVLQIGANKTEAYLIVYNTTNSTVESTRKLDFGTDNQYVWGNTLISPSGRLLTASYGWNGALRLYRSTTAYQYDGVGDITLELIKEFEVGSHAEPTIGYWDDKLIIFYRSGAGINGKFSYTYNREGNTGWSAPALLTRQVHAPYMECYSEKDELLMLCSLGNARSIIASFSTQTMEAWYSTSRILVAGETVLASGQSGGYPSFVDYGDKVSIGTYADFRRKDMKLVSRFDVRTFSKSLLSAQNSTATQREVFRNSNLDWGEYSLGTTASTIDVKVGLKLNKSVTKVRLRMTGVSKNTFIEILNDVNAVISTSSVSSINTTSYSDVDFVFPSTALTSGIYTIRIQRKDTANPFIFGWNTQNRSKHRIIKNKTIDILGMVSSSSSTLWNNAGIHIDLF